MAKIGFDVDIEAPVERVWAVLEADARRPMWMPLGIETAYPEGFSRADFPGAGFQQTIWFMDRRWTFEGEIATHEPPWLLDLSIANELAEVRLTYELLRLGTGTRLVFEGALNARTWPVRLLGVFGRPWLNAIVARHLNRLKPLAEEAPHEALWRPVLPELQGDLFGYGEKAA